MILGNALVPRRCAQIFVVQYHLPVDHCATHVIRCSDPTLKLVQSCSIPPQLFLEAIMVYIGCDSYFVFKNGSIIPPRLLFVGLIRFL